MRVIIYAERRADEIKPGDVIDGGDIGHIEVDEKRERLGEGVQLLGNPPGGEGRRKTVTYESHHLVRVMPGSRTAMKVWQELNGAVDLAVNTWMNDRDDSDDTPTPWTTDGTAIAVRVAAGEFILEAVPDDGTAVEGVPAG